MPADTEVLINRFAELIATAVVAGYRDEQKRQLLAEASSDVGLVRLWDVSTGRQIAQTTASSLAGLWSTAFDPSGRMRSREEVPEHPLSDRLINVDGVRAFLLAEGVYLSQKDVRELQFGKGSIATGIKVLMDVMGVKTADLDEVLLGGSFGSYLNPESAKIIGLVPPVDVDRILSVHGHQGSLSSGQVVTEHDIHPGAWYLDAGRIPTCIAVEAGQADLFLAGYLGSFWSTMDKVHFFLMIAGIALVASAVILAFNRPLRNVIRDQASPS